MITGVAWYGAIVATVSLVVAVYVAWRDRSRVIVYGVSGYAVPGPGPFSPEKKYIAITIANRGRRPITISTVYYTRRSDQSVSVLTDRIILTPRMLAEGRSNTYHLEEDLVDLSDVKNLVVVDETGREWKGKIKGSTRAGLEQRQDKDGSLREV